MALVLDATVGGSTANSYATLADADAYHQGRLFVEDWDNASDATKEAALVQATRMLDASIEWSGDIYTLTQSLRWPRFGATDADGRLINSDVIPQAVKDATAELARLLIASDRQSETGREGLKSIDVGSISLEFDRMSMPTSIPDGVYQMLSTLGTLKLVKTSGGVGQAKLVRA